MSDSGRGSVSRPLAQPAWVQSDTGKRHGIDDPPPMMQKTWPLIGPPNVEAQRKADENYSNAGRAEVLASAVEQIVERDAAILDRLAGKDHALKAVAEFNAEVSTAAKKAPATDVESQSILDEAKSIVSGARRKAYGHPENNFQRIADLWAAYLRCAYPTFDVGVTREDVALMMILMKVARLIESPDHRDSLVDLAGYAATIELLWENK